MAAGLLCGVLPMVAGAADITVTSAADSGPGTLRQAIVTAGPGNVIDFSPGVFTDLSHTITLSSELVLDKELTLDASAIASGVTISGNAATRLVSVTASGDLTLRKLTLEGGNSAGAAANGFGGAIYNAGHTKLEDCMVSDSAAVNYGGGISSTGSLEVIRSTVNGNSAGSLGGGIYSASSGDLVLTNSTVTGNTAVLFGGGIYHTSPLTLIHATLTENHAGNKGGGIYNDFGSALTLRSSIVAGNTAPESANFFGPFTVSSSNVTGGDPRLAPLGNYGGPTLTMPPQPDSPAIDHGADESLATDQRGFPRGLGAASDIGAVEAEVGDYNPDGLALHTRVPIDDTAGAFELSTDPLFRPVVGTFAGTGVAGFLDGFRTSGKFGFPAAVAGDAQGNIFVADPGNHRIRQILPDGTMVTIAGGGTFSGLANGPGPDARFSFPSAIAVGPDDNLYVADTFNHRICKIVRPSVEGGVWMVETLAGPNSPGNAGFLNQPGSAARFNYPYGVSCDDDGNVFVADALNHRIRKITPAGGVSTWAGSGAVGYADSTSPLSAEFDSPRDVLVVGSTLYVADTGNHRIREITSGGALASEVSTFAGSSEGFADGTGTAAQFDSPSGLATDGAGSLYVADEENARIRRITAAAEVTTVAGTGTIGFTNGKSDSAEFHAPTGLMVALDGNLIVADSGNHVLRRVVVENTEIISSLNVGDINTAGQQVSATIYAATLGLDPGATYYIRWVSSGTGSIQSIGMSFVLYELPLLTTEAADDLTPTSARLNATVDPKNSATTVVFRYSTDPELLAPWGVGTLASGLSGLSGVAPDGSGGAYVADRGNHRILHISESGVVSTFAGSGVAGFADGNGTAAQFENPAGLAIDGSGNLYVADEFNHRIRKITPGGAVSTLAGSGVAGFGDGAANAALFLYPADVAVDAAGNVFVADSGNHRIREISAATGQVSTLAGTGISGLTTDGAAGLAQFSSPRGIAVDGPGTHVWVADTGNHAARLVFSGNVFTIAGDGSPGDFSSPQGIALDEDDKVFVSDTGNHRVRRVEIDGTVTTLAGSGIDGTVDTPTAGNGLYPATAAQFSSPAGIGIDAAGRMFVSQGGSLRTIARADELPTVTVDPRPTGTGERLVSADIDQPLLPNSTYYFGTTATNYRGTVTGESLEFTTPQAGITVASGSTAIEDGQVDALDFGNTPTGQPVVRQITLSNPGNFTLNVSSIDLPAGYQMAAGPWQIAPLDTLALDVSLSAVSAGEYAGDVTIHSDAPDQTTFTFPVTGLVLDPPAVTTLDATDITGPTATLNASVNPMGSATDVWFEWSLDAEFDGFTVGTQAATLAQPSGIATDAAGNLYIADTLNHRIRKITPGGVETTFAGTGSAGFADGPGTTAQFNEPVGIVVGAGGTIYVADSNNHRIRAITAAGTVSTFAGLGSPGFTDGVPAAARFNLPSGLAINANGTLHVADRGNNRIRKVGPDGTVSTLASGFDGPFGVAIDAAGTAYVTEASGHAIHKVATNGTTTLFAGSAAVSGMVDDTGAAARFSGPSGLAFRADGTLLVADTGNHRIRAISPAGVVSSFAGSGVAGPDDGLGEVAQFDQPISLAATPSGGVVVGETAHATLRTIVSTQVLVQAASGLTGATDQAVPAELTGLDPAATYYFRAIATNGGGTSVGATLSFGGAPFLVWQAMKFGADATNPAIAGAMAEPANDGVCNLLKYAFHLEPLDPCCSGMPVVDLGSGELGITFTKVLAATDLDYIPEWSTNLVNWSPLGFTEQILNDDGTTQEVRAFLPATPGGPMFLRINVTQRQP
ncbi:MAG: hypothetical protein H7A48_12420 [Akkermansiaceae bacterium]|nr:hypothetical protein [Akkermansiaceae bacterium]